MKEQYRVQILQCKEEIERGLRERNYQLVVQEVIKLGQLGDAAGGIEPTEFTLDLYWHFRDNQNSQDQTEALDSLARAFARLLSSEPSHGYVYRQLQAIYPG